MGTFWRNQEYIFSATLSIDFIKLEETLLISDLAPGHADKTVLLRC